MTLFSSSPFVIDFIVCQASKSRHLANVQKVSLTFTVHHQTKMLLIYPLLFALSTQNTLLMHSFRVCGWPFPCLSLFFGSFPREKSIFAAFSIGTDSRKYPQGQGLLTVHSFYCDFWCCLVVIFVSCFLAPMLYMGMHRHVFACKVSLKGVVLFWHMITIENRQIADSACGKVSHRSDIDELNRR